MEAGRSINIIEVIKIGGQLTQRDETRGGRECCQEIGKGDVGWRPFGPGVTGWGVAL